jgi:hypothetical protein
VTSVGTNLIHGIWHGTSAAFGWLRDNLASLPGKVFDALKGMYELMGRVGVNIIHGMWNGIWGSLGWLKDQIKNIGGAIVGGFKSALHIKSPSRLMMPIGQNITRGVAVGMVQALDTVTRASQQIAGAAAPVVSGTAPTAARAGASAVAAAGAGGRAITGVHIEHATFESELDIDQVMRRGEFAVAAGRLG